MPRRPNITNVRKFIEVTLENYEHMLKHNHEYPDSGGLRLPPIYVDFFKESLTVGRAILKKHAAKKTRKDIYVEAPDGKHI